MKTIFKFLAKQTRIVISFTDNNMPQIRVLQLVKLDNQTFYFATSVKDRIYKQLKKSPQVEILAIQGNTTVKIIGSVTFDVSESMKQEIFHTNPIIQHLYRGIEDLNFFKINIKNAAYYDLNTIPPTLIHHIV